MTLIRMASIISSSISWIIYRATRDFRRSRKARRLSSIDCNGRSNDWQIYRSMNVLRKSNAIRCRYACTDVRLFYLVNRYRSEQHVSISLIFRDHDTES